MSSQDSSSSIGKVFIWIAWAIAMAVLVYAFQTYLDNQYNPNQDPEYSLNSRGQAEVILKQNRQGHYVTKGFINDYPVTFLLDTGATNVSVPSHIADRIGLMGQGSYRVQTANGSIIVSGTNLDSVSIGNIEVFNVEASINPKMNSDEILLGMSVLKRVEFTQRGKTLILRSLNNNY